MVERVTCGFQRARLHLNSGTRSITLDHSPELMKPIAFLGIDNVPRKAITMGIGTIKRQKDWVGWHGVSTAHIIKQTIEGEVSSNVPANICKSHENTTFILDTEASSEFTRVKTPCIVSSLIWTEELKRCAVVWLRNTSK
ncbi:MAG: hypothetical protein R2821_11655 [Flavobacteriaceae bacterium]